MKRKVLFVLFSIFLTANVVWSQSPAKTITNSDLEKFRQERLQAEKELRENYRELGFPSPEERARQDEEDAIKRAELSERLRQERLEREEIQRQNDSQYSTQYYDDGAYYDQGYYRPYFYSFGYSNNRGYRNKNRNGRSGNSRGGIRAFGRFFPTIKSYLDFRKRQLNINPQNRNNNRNRPRVRTGRNR